MTKQADPVGDLNAVRWQESTMARTALHYDQGPRDTLEDVGRALTITSLVPRYSETPVLVVCDGVGGQCFGEVASALAAELILAFLAAFLTPIGAERQSAASSPDAILDALGRSLSQANEAILCQIARDNRLKGMGTTAVCAVIVDGILYVAWAGDSRCYLCCEATLSQITRDHSEIERLVEAGLIDRQHARNHPLAHIITRHLGQPHNFQPETRAHRLVPSDVILLCSDGLTDVVTNEEISGQIEAYQSGEFLFDDLAARLVQQALRAGTQDNVTVLCCEYQPESMLARFERTQTGAYRVQLAKTIQQLTKETHNV